MAVAQVSEILALEDISKSYGGVNALLGASMTVRRGEVHALLGENGAGKSTLIKIVAGAVARDSGAIRWRREPVEIRSRADSIALGIGVVFQQLHVIDHLTVAENLTLNREPARCGYIDKRAERRLARHALSRLGVHIDLDRKAGELRTAERQLVEIARALSEQAELLIMDEPTASLGERERTALFDVIGELRAQGIAIIYISHRLDEVGNLSDRMTILRDGHTVSTHDTGELSRQDVIRLMVGRALQHAERRRASTDGRPVALRANMLSTPSGLCDISFELREGEILGVFGLLGSGRTELARALFGVDPISQGTVEVSGTPVKVRSPTHAKQLGFGFVPEDRATQGVFQRLSIRDNITAASSDLVARFGLVRGPIERSISERIVRRLRVRARSIEQLVGTLSGGNQQKVVVGRWFARDARILILDDPTVGVDVGAKDEIYTIIDELVRSGASILFLSSDLDELIDLSDRAMVLSRGRIAGFVEGDRITQEDVLSLAVGHVA